MASWLPKVISTLTQAGSLLDAIDVKAREHFAAHPDEGLQRKYNDKMAKARIIVSAAAHASRGGDALAREDVNKAWAEFKPLYGEILALLGPLGVVAPSADGAVGVPENGGPLLVPPPEALQLDDV